MTFKSHPMNVSILHLKCENGVRSKNCFACYSHCYVAWRPLTTGIISSQCPSSRDAVFVTSHLRPLISACLNAVKKFCHNETYLQRIGEQMIGWISHKRSRWLPWRAWWHTLTFVTHEITWRPVYVAKLSPLLWQNWCHIPPKSTVMLSWKTKNMDSWYIDFQWNAILLTIENHVVNKRLYLQHLTLSYYIIELLSLNARIYQCSISQKLLKKAFKGTVFIMQPNKVE